MRRPWEATEYSVPVSKHGTWRAEQHESHGQQVECTILAIDRIERHEIRRVSRMDYIDHSLQDYMMSALGSRLTPLVHFYCRS